VAVHKSLARLLSADGSLIGEGRAYVHLRLPKEQPQSATGTLSLDWWDETVTAQGTRLELQGGPELPLAVEADTLSGCVVGRILRYTADWPGQV
jgi:hypothetical protein